MGRGDGRTRFFFVGLKFFVYIMGREFSLVFWRTLEEFLLDLLALLFFGRSSDSYFFSDETLNFFGWFFPLKMIKTKKFDCVLLGKLSK